MKFLIVEDDPMLRKVLTAHLAPFADIDIAIDGKEAIEAYSRAWDAGEPYILVCLDVDLPKLNGDAVLQYIRRVEQAKGLPEDEKTKILMTTAVSDKSRVIDIIKSGPDGYLLKPYTRERLAAELKKLGFRIG